MLLWAAIIVTLIISLIFGLLFRFPQEYIVGSAYLMLLVALGVFYRVLRRIKSGRIEDLSQDIERLQRENSILRSKMGIGPLDSLDEKSEEQRIFEEPKEDE